MAQVLCVLSSGRKKGYTATLLAQAMEGLKSFEGIEIEYVHLFDYKFGPCTSCFNCIRAPQHFCTLPDDFGKKGKGELYQKVKKANGLLIADAVHMWGPTAQCHLFFERCYPFIWSGHLNGLPFASISCATNQGFQLLAQRQICKWAFGKGMRYIGGLAVHAGYFQEALRDAKRLGEQLAEAALRDAREGRKPFKDEERFLFYMDKPFNAFWHYLENLTNGTLNLESSLIHQALKKKTFRREEAIELLKKAKGEFETALDWHKRGNLEKANKHLVKASAFWTHATWKEFLELQVIKMAPPEVYRPLPNSR